MWLAFVCVCVSIDAYTQNPKGKWKLRILIRMEPHLILQSEQRLNLDGRYQWWERRVLCERFSKGRGDYSKHKHKYKYKYKYNLAALMMKRA